MTHFEILKPENPQWLAAFKKLPAEQQDVSYHPGFAQLNQLTINHDHEILCAVMDTSEETVLYPFIKRELGILTGFSSYSGWYDITGLYGRGGIVSTWGDNSAHQKDRAAFHASMSAYCLENKIICGFDRFHPVMQNEHFASPTEQIMDVGGFVVVDIRPEMDDINMSFKQSVRKDVRKSERNGISCFSEANGNRLDEFLDIYNHTMTRNNAGDFYYFSEEYFRLLLSLLPDNFHFFYAMADGVIISCELVLHHGKYGHSFLGGTRREALALGANPALKLEVIRVLKDLGCEYFLLGGGTQPNDGVFKFKKAYAPNGVLPSRIGGNIWNLNVYEAFKKECDHSENNRFQFYDVN